MVCNYFYFRQTGANICRLKPAHFYRKLLQFATFPLLLLTYERFSLLLLLEGTGLGLIFKPKGNHTPKAHLWALFFSIQFYVSSRYTQDICKRRYLLLPSFAECLLRARSMRGSMARHLRKRGKGRSVP